MRTKYQTSFWFSHDNKIGLDFFYPVSNIYILFDDGFCWILVIALKSQWISLQSITGKYFLCAHEKKNIQNKFNCIKNGQQTLTEEKLPIKNVW